jgi:hypothetical protein
MSFGELNSDEYLADPARIGIHYLGDKRFGPVDGRHAIARRDYSNGREDARSERRSHEVRRRKGFALPVIVGGRIGDDAALRFAVRALCPQTPGIPDDAGCHNDKFLQKYHSGCILVNFAMLAKAAAILVLLLGSCFVSRAQEGISPSFENGSNLNVLYRSDASGMIYANTRGYGLLFRRGKHITANTRSYYEIDIQTLDHPKEISLRGEYDERSRFVYGKLNSVFLLRGALGLQNVLFSKADNKAVEVRYSYSLGPLLAFAKPYYVRIYRTTVTNRTQTALVKFDSEGFTQDSARIIGRGAYTDGLSEMVIYPGVSAKFNLSFEYAPYTNLIRAIETGISLDYYPKALPIMARNPAENFILTLNIGFVIGKKWF